ncbi:hypothetical protein JOB18_003953 [Solea senegalensis]|uniref:PiggyBac transposable element-derived protein domain-containing protein n=1 Tax=Solea senegalensis TaxID=28829 RepID=A0AAV6QU83_SOLSE|nr:hypothetical protein JOB18_003953 [Solea senegalensis]
MKNFVCATVDGIVLDFDIYQGAHALLEQVDEPEGLGLGSLVIDRLSQTLHPGTKVYYDRFFTTIQGVERMMKKQVYVTGTVMKNRRNKTDKTMKKAGRGTSAQVTTGYGKTCVVKSYDNKPVMMMSVVHATQPEDTCQRWDKKLKRYVTISQPSIIHVYNSKMVDAPTQSKVTRSYKVYGTMNQGKRSVQTRLKTSATMEANPASPSSSEASQGNNMGDIFAEIGKMNTTLNKVASDVSTIKSDTTELKNNVSALQTCLEEAESRIGDMEDSTASMANENKVLRQKVEQLWSCVDDQENRGRRKNIRLIGMKKGKETGNTMNDYVKKIMNEGLGLQGAEYEIERSHRSGGPRPGNNNPPRVILVKFIRYTARQKVLMAAKKERGIRWEDCTLSIYEDMTKERTDQRRQFSPIMKALWDPAILRFTWKGEKLSFTDPKKAETFVRENIQSTENDCMI